MPLPKSFVPGHNPCMSKKGNGSDDEKSKDQKSKDEKSKIIIEGITETGEVFRPSDWAERVSGNLSTFRNHRIYYSPLLKPLVKNEQKCVVLDKSLKITHPALYEQIMEFAKTNKLRICGEEDDQKPTGEKS